MELYAHASLLRGKNACLKVIFGLTVLILCMALESTAVFLWVTVSMMALAVFGGRMKLSAYLGLLGIPLFFILFGGCALWFATGDIGQTCHVTLRAISAVNTFYFLTLSTTVGELMSVLQRFHVPPVLTGLMYLIYRFIFVLTDVWQSMYLAAQSRLGYVDYRTSLRTFGGMGSNLLVCSLKRADDCYNAMAARGYEGTIHFQEPKRRCSPGDVWAAVCYILVTVAIGRCFG